MPNLSQVNYSLKLKALLHDPVNKIWAMSNKFSLKHENYIKNYKLKWHEKVAEDLFRFILEDNLKDDKIEIADILSSAISRIVVAPQLKDETKRQEFNEDAAVFLEDAKYIDPFSGNEIDIGFPKNQDEVKNIFEKIGELDFSNQQERARLSFLFLWRFLTETFPWVNTHPADSRAPNHSIYDHLVQTSALVSCIDVDKPAFLIFTLTPVQSFIEKARKTSDLWSGSYLLSYLIYKAIEVVMENYGPDHIIFPNLLGQPLVDKWLDKKLKDKFEVFKNENWYNKFKENINSIEKLTVANFPNRFLAIVPYKEAKEVAQKCQESIEKVIEEFLNKLTEDISNIFLNENKNKIKENIVSFFKTYWVVIPWYKDYFANVDAIINEYKNLVGENDLPKLIEIIKSNPYYSSANAGNAYSLLVELTERFLASRKMIKDFVVIKPQTGEKCHLCGEYDILPLDNRWESLVQKHYVSESERLCGVCLFKRLLSDIMKIELGLKDKIRFPSTSDLATVKYKSRLSNDLIDKFIQKYNEIFSDTKPAEIKSVPALKDLKLYTIDGQWLMESSYRKEYLKKEFGIEMADDKVNEMKNFLKDNKINPPVYYAILAMDGDNMGKWLKGDFLPEIEKLIHQKAKESLLNYSKADDRKNLESLLNMKHPMSPSFHNLFSRKLSDFALNKVREIIENKYYGKLIYAGGDDVLAFLPIEDAVDCAFDLNNEFKLLFSNNKNASMSAGIVFVHHKYPLELALNEVRDAEKKAKNKYGRNAFCIKYITGGGQDRLFGIKWDDKGFFNDVVCKYETEELSTKFAYDYMNIVNEIGYFEEEKDINKKNNLKQILRNELLRIYRHKKSKEIDKEFEQNMLEYFDKMCPKDFANMFIIARFVAGIKN